MRTHVLVLASIGFAAFAACGGGSTVSPDQCTTRAVWTGGDQESPRMHPGGTCITCHAQQGDEPGIQFTIAGTVFPAPDDPTDCLGSDGRALDLHVEITDAMGKVLTLPVNDVGNFYTTQPVAMPYSARVLGAGGKVRSMGAKQSVGECNSCHAEVGANGAPGRILAP